jgi:hypothetical protein
MNISIVTYKERNKIIKEIRIRKEKKVMKKQYNDYI